jgi:NADPH:quinone reductase-like Zn-dependent oxidoreductase
MRPPRPSARTAITVQSRNHAIISRDVPIPALQPDQLLIKTVVVSLKPSDWMLIDWSPRPGAIVGVDFAGIVEETGLEAEGWNVGDRVAGFVHGGMSEYCLLT